MDNCSSTGRLDFHQPARDISLPTSWNAFYFYVIVPIAYIGSTLTVLLMVKILRYKRKIPDILVGILAINDFFLVMFTFTPTIIAQTVDHWFGREICYMHHIVKEFFSINVFLVIIFMSIERSWAICKPFHYERVATINLVSRIFAIFTVCSLIFSVVPALVVPVSLQPGWYCDIAFDPILAEKTCSSNYDFVYQLETFLSFEVVIVVTGLFIGIASNRKLLFVLGKTVAGSTQDRRLEKRMIYTVCILNAAFVLTWIPSVISILLCLFGEQEQMCAKAEYAASRIVHINVAMNPFLYAIMKPSYRRGYWDLLKKGVHYLSFGVLTNYYPVKDGANILHGALHTHVWSIQAKPVAMMASGIDGRLPSNRIDRRSTTRNKLFPESTVNIETDYTVYNLQEEGKRHDECNNPRQTVESDSNYVSYIDKDCKSHVKESVNQTVDANDTPKVKCNITPTDGFTVDNDSENAVKIY